MLIFKNILSELKYAYKLYAYKKKNVRGRPNTSNT